MKFHNGHLAYCTNIHPAETWEETQSALKKHTLKVRDRVSPHQPYAIGLRLSAIAAKELLSDDNLPDFKQWLGEENCYVFTINGFPYGAFHGASVKEKVYLPDWSSEDRLIYTKNLFSIIAQLVPEGIDGSVSTLPASFKEFQADELEIFKNLEACAVYIEELSQEYNRDLHLGMEPEPLGHFENTEETLAFFERMLDSSSTPGLLRKRIGINYDTCHFALEFDDCYSSLLSFENAGLRISKVHLSSALTLDLASVDALSSLHAFDEPTYLHQVIIQSRQGDLIRHKDIPQFLASPTTTGEARIHFHIPLYSEPEAPLGSTQDHVRRMLEHLKNNPDFCTHFEIETYTWGVLPNGLQIKIENQIAQEYAWVINQ
ncbi:metabolite traffic protein EboE [Akkermansiaceae bacterium]|nr:metabolite traffic protein EboE [Akkermansiaceae bacterium]